MCAITGILSGEPGAGVSAQLLRRMNDIQAHRGPDEHGLHFEPGIGLGHRRLSIIDLAGGRQPLFNEDESIVVVYNGEIYNFQPLAAELAARGHRFRTHSDTEVIVHAWEEWGERCLERFRGMFAFALWDRPRQTLFLARDRLGIKPLHYAWLADGSLIFASELKALQQHPALPRTLAPEAVEEYFAFGYIPEPRTIYAGVHKLAAGHRLLVRRGGPRPQPRQWWDIPFAPAQATDAAAAGEELLARLREAVRLRLIAEVPLGAFLSGGVDSSAVVAMMAQIMGAEGGGPVNTCSIAFGDPAFNEARYAEQVAQRYGTAHRTEQLDPDRFDLLDTLAALYDEPYADSSALPTYLVCALARQQVTVALSGDGGDENLAGYKRYRWHLDEQRLRALLPLAARRLLFGPLGRAYPPLYSAPRFLRARATFQALARDAVSGYFNIIAVLDDNLRGRLFSSAFERRLDGYHAAEVLHRHAAASPTDHPLSLVQYLDMKTYLVDDILTKVDRASMAHALEVRVPLLDHELVEWMSGLPPELKLQGREGKHLLKSALQPHLPADLLYRPKMGFAVPLAGWFRGPLRERVRSALLGPRLADSGYFDRGFLHHLLDTHDAGRRDYSAALWSLLMFEAFLKREDAAAPARAEAA
ncbi:asparagine synthetase B [Thiohalocapsa halophila]|uniref:asparagine synthase (glutamine-hydrolyzing) n=1 Tax=Thiohalocapsa halophila TaxID=69359 RepID=A0ABS1CGN8_9GAMM|nr:XrtA/PEP-CTERM system amidotransferase [Thiohalocapsa halophila]MBK1631086.1 asparagine synthetase B [Thiohalocapsa halophila]